MQVLSSDGFKPMTIGAKTKIPKLDEICEGNIILIRFIRSNRQLDIFGEKFTVSKDLVYSYVKAIIVTQINQLQLYLGDDLVQTFHYQLSGQN
jgi:putative transposase